MPSPLTQTTGRRKEAVARVRLRPGTGTITINARAFDNYFTSATHRQMVMEPLRLIDAQQTYDIDATIEGGGVAGSGRRAASGNLAFVARIGRSRSSRAEEGRTAHARLAQEGDQEVRPQEGA